MKSFQLNPQQLEVITNGATKFWVPCDIGGIEEMEDYYVNQHLEYHLNGDLVKELSPLQPGESYFVQEDCAINDDGFIMYQCDCSEPILNISTYTEHTPANQMTEAQSKYKFTVTDVEVKQVQDIYEEDGGWLLFSIMPNVSITNDFQEWHDSQYPDQPYSSNPTGFLVTIERI